MTTITYNTKEEFIRNIAYILGREFTYNLWERIKVYFDNIDFTKYDGSVKDLEREEQAQEVLTIFDSCYAVLEENLDTQQLKNLFTTIEDYLDYGNESLDDTGCTNRELGYNRAILDFNLLE